MAVSFAFKSFPSDPLHFYRSLLSSMFVKSAIYLKPLCQMTQPHPALSEAHSLFNNVINS